LKFFENPKGMLGWELGICWVFWVMTGLLLGSLGYDWVIAGFIGFLLGFAGFFGLDP
jgi:hypothetical protein